MSNEQELDNAVLYQTIRQYFGEERPAGEYALTYLRSPQAQQDFLNAWKIRVPRQPAPKSQTTQITVPYGISSDGFLYPFLFDVTEKQALDQIFGKEIKNSNGNYYGEPFRPKLSPSHNYQNIHKHNLPPTEPQNIHEMRDLNQPKTKAVRTTSSPHMNDSSGIHPVDVHVPPPPPPTDHHTPQLNVSSTYEHQKPEDANPSDTIELSYNSKNAKFMINTSCNQIFQWVIHIDQLNRDTLENGSKLIRILCGPIFDRDDTIKKEWNTCTLALVDGPSRKRPDAAPMTIVDQPMPTPSPNHAISPPVQPAPMDVSPARKTHVSNHPEDTARNESYALQAPPDSNPDSVITLIYEENESNFTVGARSCEIYKWVSNINVQNYKEKIDVTKPNCILRLDDNTPIATDDKIQLEWDRHTISIL